MSKRTEELGIQAANFFKKELETMSTQRAFQSGRLTLPDTIVVATDLTDLSELLPHAIAQAKASGAALHIVHAIPPNSVYVPESGMVPPVDPFQMVQDAQIMMEGIVLPIRDQGLRCTTEVRHGNPSEVVAEVTRETGAQRVIVSTHGRKGITRIVLGSVAIQILTSSKVPVCTIGPHCQAPSGTGIKNILHPTSLGPDAEASAKLALDLALYHRAHLTLLHVITPDSAMVPSLDPQYAFANLEHLLPLSSSDFSTMVHTRVVSGEKQQEILREAEVIHPDLLVLGAHSSSGSGRTAYSVVVSATCPVLSLHTAVEPKQSRKERAADSVLA